MSGKNGHGKTAEAEVFDFFSSEETHTLYLNERLWVRIKRELDFGEQNELDNAALRGFSRDEVAKAAEGGSMVFYTDLGRQRLLKMALYIDDWNLTDREGKTIRWPRKVDERQALLRRMNPKWASLISGEIDRLITEASAQAQGEGYPAAVPDEEADKDPLRLAAPGGQER